MDLLLQSACQLARLIHARRVSSREVVDCHIAQIEKVNPALNAVVCDRFEQARQEADEADRRLALDGESVPPLWGVPCTIKECFALEGMPNTAGLVSRVGLRARHDALTVSRLRQAGAIPLGVTNVSELCMWMESDNRVYGRTNNPYDTRRTVGGSSGGEAAIVAAGGSPFGLGSDVAGSIRMPSFFNGVFGHKPTGGWIPNDGQFPTAHGQGLRYLTTGPICRRAEDLWPLLNLLAGPDRKHSSPSQVRLEGMRVLLVDNNGVVRVSPDLREAMRRAAASLGCAGATVVEARIPALTRSLEIWSAMLSAAGGESFASMMGGGVEIDVTAELIRWAMRRSDHTLPAIALAAAEKLPARMKGLTERMVQAGLELKRDLVERIGPHGVMLYPPYACPAPRHYKPLFPPFNWIYTAIINVMELPSTQVPLGLNSQGLPLGVQVVGIHHHDHVTVAVAQHLERAFGGWVFPGPAKTDHAPTPIHPRERGWKGGPREDRTGLQRSLSEGPVP